MHYLCSEKLLELCLVIDNIELRNMPPQRYPIYVKGYWFDLQGWEGTEPVHAPDWTTVPKYQRMFEGEAIEAQEQGEGGRMRVGFGSSNIGGGELPSTLYPPHYYFLGLSFWQRKSGFSFGKFKSKEDE